MADPQTTWKNDVHVAGAPGRWLTQNITTNTELLTTVNTENMGTTSTTWTPSP